MPATFDLDLLTVDYEIDTDGYEDVHTRSQEDIALPDQNPIVPDNYVTICFDEDETFGYLNAQQLPDSEATPMEEVIISQSPSTNIVDVQDGGPSFRRESHTTNHTGDDNLRIFQDPIIKETMPVEEFRNPSNDYDTIGNLPDLGFNETEPNMDFNQTVNEKDQTVETSPTQPAGPQTPVSTQDGASDAPVCGGHDSRPTFECGSVEFRPIHTPQMEQG